MIIKEKGNDFLNRVLRIYWINKERHYFVIPYPSHNGLIAYNNYDEFEIIDNSLDGMIIDENCNADHLVNNLIHNNDLLLGMVDSDPAAMEKFWSLCEENNIDIFFPNLIYVPYKGAIGSERCPCCNNKALNSNGCYETCPACGWIDDPIQRDDPSYPGGENILSLVDAQAKLSAATTARAPRK